MGEKRPSVRLPAYPQNLLKKNYANSRETVTECLQLLAYHYGLASKFGFAIGFRSPDAPNIPEAWADLACRLIIDFVPAFKVPKRRGRKKASFHNPDHRGVLAGLLYSASYDPVKYGQAEFVWAVRAAKGSKSLSFAFQQLEKNEKKRTLLPLRYRSLKRAGSIRKAYYDIDTEIQTNPERFAPDPTKNNPTPPGWVYGDDKPPLPSLLGDALKSKSKSGTE